jgi:hypothetical protein
MNKKAKHKLAQEKERAFLLGYYGKDSPTKLDRRASALAAGYTLERAVWNANRLLDKYRDTGFRECSETVGISAASLAVMFKEILETSEGRDAISSLRLALANRGEATDHKDAPRGMTFEGPVMVIVGATPERMEALRRGGAPRIARTKDHAPELSPARDEDVIEVEAVADPPAEDSRQLKPSEFAGRNRGSVQRLQQGSS